MSTTADHFQAALLALTRSGSIKDRLLEAYRNHLAQVEESELPAEVREEFRLFSQALTREPPLLRGEDASRATVRKMSLHEAAAMASIVVRMFAAVSGGAALGSWSKSMRSDSNVVPLYQAEANRA
ncbi:MAG TPA: hypothetical protein VFB37_03650 [Steroidobacteraceae bacterium]|nr:hypothetical protein [Steroidobacteraceae bacterium]